MRYAPLLAVLAAAKGYLDEELRMSIYTHTWTRTTLGKQFASVLLGSVLVFIVGRLASPREQPHYTRANATNYNYAYTPTPTPMPTSQHAAYGLLQSLARETDELVGKRGRLIIRLADVDAALYAVARRRATIWGVMDSLTPLLASERAGQRVAATSAASATSATSATDTVDVHS